MINSLCCIGDSHISNFTNMHTLLHFGIWHTNGNWKSFNVGPYLAYSFYKKDRRDRIIRLVKTNSGPNVHIVLSFGEIDTREHVLKQSELQCVSTERIMGWIIDNYFKLIDNLKENGFHKLIVTEVIPNRHGISEIKKDFNSMMKTRCEKENIIFLRMVDEAYEDSFYLDDIHMFPQKVFPKVEQSLIEKFG